VHATGSDGIAADARARHRQPDRQVSA
jgi:hypothetical protein